MPYGQLDILAFDVAAEEQRRGIGRRALLAIREMHPLPRLTALNDDAVSRGFWDRVGWVRHESKRGFFSERVTYSERQQSDQPACCGPCFVPHWHRSYGGPRQSGQRPVDDPLSVLAAASVAGGNALHEEIHCPASDGLPRLELSI